MEIVPIKNYTPPYPGKPSGGNKNPARFSTANGKRAAIRAATILATTLAVTGGMACARYGGDIQIPVGEIPITTPEIAGGILVEDVCTPEPTEDAIWMGVAKIEDTVKFPFMP